MCISSKTFCVKLSVAGYEKNAADGDQRPSKSLKVGGGGGGLNWEPQGEEYTQHTRRRVKGNQKQRMGSGHPP